MGSLTLMISSCGDGAGAGQNEAELSQKLAVALHHADSLQAILDGQLNMEAMAAPKSAAYPINDAKAEIAQYLTSTSTKLIAADACPNDNTVPDKLIGFHLSRADIQKIMGNLDGLRFYFGEVTRQNGSVYNNIFVVGTSKVGDQTLSDCDSNYDHNKYRDRGIVHDFVQPCPTFCNYSVDGSTPVGPLDGY